MPGNLCVRIDSHIECLVTVGKILTSESVSAIYHRNTLQGINLLTIKGNVKGCTNALNQILIVLPCKMPTVYFQG
jgi:hypothetical protein